MEIQEIFSRRRILFSAVGGLLIFALFYFVKPVYYRSQERTLTQKLQAQISALVAPTFGTSSNDVQYANGDKLQQIQETKSVVAKLQKILHGLSKNTLTYERDYILLDLLERNYQYTDELSNLMAKIFEYDPENDLNSRSVTEYKGDFMYRLSLAQYALNQITARLEKYDDDQGLVVYTKEITAQFPPMIDLIDRLIAATNQNRIADSNHLRSQYITDIQQLQANLKPMTDQILQKLNQTNQTILTQIKI